MCGAGADACFHKCTLIAETQDGDRAGPLSDGDHGLADYTRTITVLEALAVLFYRRVLCPCSESYPMYVCRVHWRKYICRNLWPPFDQRNDVEPHAELRGGRLQRNL